MKSFLSTLLFAAFVCSVLNISECGRHRGGMDGDKRDKDGSDSKYSDLKRPDDDDTDDRDTSRRYDDRGPSRGFDRDDDRGGRYGGEPVELDEGYGRYDDDRGRGDYGHHRDGGRRGHGSGYRRDKRGYDDRHRGRSEKGYSQESSQDDCSCEEKYHRVCGSDGLTYSNSCLARCAGVDNAPAHVHVY